MSPIVFYISESISIIAFIFFVLIARLFSDQQAALVRRFLLLIVGAGLLGWFILLITGIFGVLTHEVHGLVGHLMLPVVASASGLWLGYFFPKVGQHPRPVLLRSVILLLLCFGCFSNTRTGYLGPSRFDPVVYPETKIRFDVFHQTVWPVLIGLILIAWIYRLVTRLAGSTNNK